MMRHLDIKFKQTGSKVHIDLLQSWSTQKVHIDILQNDFSFIKWSKIQVSIKFDSIAFGYCHTHYKFVDFWPIKCYLMCNLITKTFFMYYKSPFEIGNFYINDL